MRVAGSVGVVTGGAGGLGGGVVRMLTETGGRAAILDLPSSPGGDLAAELGEHALFVPLDVSDGGQVEAAIDRVVEHFGRIDLCVNAAGISPASRIVDGKGRIHPRDLFAKTVEINLVGAFDVLRLCAGAMSRNEPSEEGERGLIVNVSSAAALEGQVGQAAYSASKGALAAMTLPLARDLAKWGIRVMAVAPGIMDTPMLTGIDDKRREALLTIPVFPKRLGTPKDFSALVRTFIENTLLNGELVRLDAAARL